MKKMYFDIDGLGLDLPVLEERESIDSIEVKGNYITVSLLTETAEATPEGLRESFRRRNIVFTYMGHGAYTNKLEKVLSYNTISTYVRSSRDSEKCCEEAAQPKTTGTTVVNGQLQQMELPFNG